MLSFVDLPLEELMMKILINNDDKACRLINTILIQIYKFTLLYMK